MFAVFPQTKQQICCSLSVQEEEIHVFGKAPCLFQGSVSIPWLYKYKVAVKSLFLWGDILFFACVCTCCVSARCGDVVWT